MDMGCLSWLYAPHCSDAAAGWGRAGKPGRGSEKDDSIAGPQDVCQASTT
jgi:hypothetical protein